MAAAEPLEIQEPQQWSHHLAVGAQHGVVERRVTEVGDEAGDVGVARQSAPLLDREVDPVGQRLERLRRNGRWGC